MCRLSWGNANAYEGENDQNSKLLSLNTLGLLTETGMAELSPSRFPSLLARVLVERTNTLNWETTTFIRLLAAQTISAIGYNLGQDRHSNPWDIIFLLTLAAKSYP
jgi:hypothetical protein